MTHRIRHIEPPRATILETFVTSRLSEPPKTRERFFRRTHPVYLPRLASLEVGTSQEPPDTVEYDKLSLPEPGSSNVRHFQPPDSPNLKDAREQGSLSGPTPSQEPPDTIESTH